MGRTSRLGYLANRQKLRYGGVLCGICGEEIDLTLPRKDPMSLSADHIIPVEQGGSDHADNLMPAHRGCNQRKRALDLDQCVLIGIAGNIIDLEKGQGHG
jgi:5-methylcytosine-specific restriction endonuclease McrA